MRAGGEIASGHGYRGPEGVSLLQPIPWPSPSGGGNSVAGNGFDAFNLMAAISSTPSAGQGAETSTPEAKTQNEVHDENQDEDEDQSSGTTERMTPFEGEGQNDGPLPNKRTRSQRRQWYRQTVVPKPVRGALDVPRTHKDKLLCKAWARAGVQKMLQRDLDPESSGCSRDDGSGVPGSYRRRHSNVDLATRSPRAARVPVGDRQEAVAATGQNSPEKGRSSKAIGRRRSELVRLKSRDLDVARTVGDVSPEEGVEVWVEVKLGTEGHLGEAGWRPDSGSDPFVPPRVREPVRPYHSSKIISATDNRMNSTR